MSYKCHSSQINSLPYFYTMKKLLSILILTISISVSAQNNLVVDSLIQKKQFQLAWKLLNTQQRTLQNEIKKIDLALKYFTKTVNHQSFAFSNLEPNESLFEKRRAAEEAMIPLVKYPIDAVLDSLIQLHPNNGFLYQLKGNFYYDIFIIYGNKWKINKQEVLRRMYASYTIAEEKGKADYLTYYALGYFFNLNEDWQKAKNYFEKSLALDSNYAPTHYNLAYINLEIDSNEVALYHAYTAYRLYKYINYKNDAGQMAGSILAKLNRHEEAISLLLDCDRLIPKSYYTYYYLLNSFLALNRMQEAEITTDNIFALDWKSHTINTDLIELFVKYNKTTQLEKFYLDKLQSELYDMEFRGYTFLHLSQMFAQTNQKNKAAIYLKNASESFNICYDAGHPVFRVLNKMEQDLK